jgi:hypothetical protein
MQSLSQDTISVSTDAKGVISIVTCQYYSQPKMLSRCIHGDVWIISVPAYPTRHSRGCMKYIHHISMIHDIYLFQLSFRCCGYSDLKTEQIHRKQRNINSMIAKNEQ